MRKLCILTIFLILLLSSSHAFVVEDREKKYAYEVSSDIEFMNTSMNNPHISASSYLLVWNTTEIKTPHKALHGNFTMVYNFANLTVAFGERIEIYSGENLKKIGEFPIELFPHTVYCNYPYLAFSSQKTYFVNVKNVTMREFNISADKILIHGDHFFLSSGKYLYGISFSSVLWNITFDEKIRDFAIYHDIIYVEFPHEILMVKNGKIVKKYPTGGIKIYTMKNHMVIEMVAEDDEGKKYWIFSLYDYNFSFMISHFIYVEPKNIYNHGNILIIFDGRYTYLLNQSLLIFRSRAMEFTLFRDTLAYLLENNTVELINLNWRIVDSGTDNDGDWIMDKYDDDDDDDGIPDWWEEKYGLNPDNPSDANMDYDNDGLTNYQEYLNHTNPRMWDTDEDGLSDGFEVNTGLNPLSRDSDNDGFPDAWELKHGMNPRISDRGYFDSVVYSPLLIIILLILIFAGIKRGKEKSFIRSRF